jgi:anaerobic selenocysteine-containing dehydrogenase
VTASRLGSSVRRHFITCTLCEATCGLEVVTDGRQVVSIRGDEHDPFSRGHLCPKAVALKDIHHDPDRLRRPLRRDGGRWDEVGWDEALDAAAARLRAVQRAHGRDAVAVYLGNPNVHSLGSMLSAPGFARTLRTRNRFSATSVDQLPHQLVAHLMFGHQLLLPVPDLDRTGHLLIVGANPAVSNGSLMTAPGVAKRLRAIRARGGRIVVIDPRRTETATLADAHHFVQPGSDAFLLLALLHTIFAEGLERPGRSRAWTLGLGRVRAAAAGFPPDRVSRITGMPAQVIAQVAREFAIAERAVCYGRLGVSTQRFGSLACWLVNVLNLVTGRLDEPGGAMFTRPAIDVVGGGYVGRGHVGRWTSRVRGLPEIGGELPVAVLSEEIETAGPGQVRALVTIGGNPVLSTPNGARLDRALSGLDAMIAIDIHLNETTRHAHLILPPASPLERDHYDLIFNALAIQNVAKFSPAVFERPRDARHDWEILDGLSWRLAAGGPLTRIRARARASLRRWAGPRRILDHALRTGPYGKGWLPGRRGLSMRRLLEARHGLLLGPLEPCLPGRLATPDRTVALAPERLLADLPRLERALEDDSRPPGTLALIGRRDLRSNNSWMHNSARLMKGAPRCTLLMHPDDAGPRHITGGDIVVVRSRVGAVEVPVVVTPDIARGVVCLPHGWGHQRPGVRLRVASAQPGASLNDVTDELEVDAISGNAALNGTWVRVERR